MRAKELPQVGDVVELGSFAFMNPFGGTGLSDWDHNPRFAGIARAKIVKSWHDYETGWSYIGSAESDDLKQYMKANAAPGDQRVLFGQFDLA